MSAAVVLITSRRVAFTRLAAELKAAEMAFDLGADGFVGKLDFMTRVEMEKVGTYCACYGVFSAYNKCSRFVTFR